MKGIELLYDDKGKPRAVVIDLRKHGRLWEDFYDHMVIQERKKEPRIPWKEVKAQLRRRAAVK